MGTSRETTESRPTIEELPKPFGKPFLFAWILLALSLGTGAAAFRTFNRYETSFGYLQAKSRGLYARRDARIAEIHVKSGQIVEPGSPLVTLQDLELERRVRDMLHRISVQRAQLEERAARADVELHNRKQALETEIFNVRMQKAGLEHSLTHQEPSLGPLKIGVRPISEGDEVAASPSASEQVPFSPQIRMCDDRIATLDQEAEKLPEEIKTACGVKTAEARLKQLEQELVDLEQEQKTLTLVAEVHGTVGVLQAQVGDLVTSRQQIVSLMDEDQPYLVVKVPSEKLSDYVPGTPLRIVFPGRVEMEGRVEVIPPQAESLRKATDSVQNEPAQVAVVVSPVGAEWPRIPFGATVEVQRDH